MTKPSKKVALFVQYTNPGGYPPLIHIARILSGNDWLVFFAGVSSLGDSRNMHFPTLCNVWVHLWKPTKSSALRKLHFLAFNFWIVCLVLYRRPRIIYCSDLWSCPVGFALSLCRFKVIYHEHDAPLGFNSLWLKTIAWFRSKLVQKCITVTPTEGRSEILRQIGAKSNFVVPNYPSIEECNDFSPEETVSTELRLVYQGSIVPMRPPATLIQALADKRIVGKVRLAILGYETVGSKGYIKELIELAHTLGVSSMVSFHPAISRPEMLRWGSQFDVGVALMPFRSLDKNYLSMVGASNKPYDYLLQGLAVIVNDEPDWKRAFFDEGVGVVVDPTCPRKIAEQLNQLILNPEHVRSMRNVGRRKILDKWHYEKAFQAVLDICNSYDKEGRTCEPSIRG